MPDVKLNALLLQSQTQTCLVNVYFHSQLYTAATMAPGVATYGQGTGDILLDDLACTGSETSIFNCPHNGVGSHNCGHSEDAGAVCQREHLSVKYFISLDSTWYTCAVILFTFKEESSKM